MKLSYRVFLIAGLSLALALAFFASPFASSSPDGLEKVAKDHGFLEKAEGAPTWGWALMPDYAFPGIAREGLATALAGAVGTLIVFGAGLALARVARGARRVDPPRPQ